MEPHYSMIINIALAGAALMLSVLAACSGLRRHRESRRIKRNLGARPACLNINSLRSIQARLAGRQSFCFVVTGDTHQDFRALSRLLAHAARHRPAFVIHTGDFSNQGSYAEYARMARFMESCAVPLLVCPGNHDLQNLGARCFAYLFGPENYYFDLGRHRFIFLNNVERKINGDVAQLSASAHCPEPQRGFDGQLLDRLETLMAGSQSNFLIMHMAPPLKAFEGFGFVRNGQAFLRIVNQHASRVALVMFGHRHGFGKEQLHNVTYVNAGGGRAFNDKRGYSPGPGHICKHNYVLVSVADDAVDFRPYYPLEQIARPASVPAPFWDLLAQWNLIDTTSPAE